MILMRTKRKVEGDCFAALVLTSRTIIARSGATKQSLSVEINAVD